MDFSDGSELDHILIWLLPSMYMVTLLGNLFIKASRNDYSTPHPYPSSSPAYYQVTSVSPIPHSQRLFCIYKLTGVCYLLNGNISFHLSLGTMCDNLLTVMVYAFYMASLSPVLHSNYAPWPLCLLSFDVSLIRI
jgi:hypothetical protein